MARWTGCLLLSLLFPDLPGHHRRHLRSSGVCLGGTVGFMPQRGRLSVLLMAFLVPTAAAVKLELPAFLKTVASFSGKTMPGGPVTDLWWNPLILLSGTGKPTVQDNANA